MSRADMLQGINRAKNAVDKDGGEWKPLAHWVVELAAEIWDDGSTGLREDFCVQHVCFPMIVFGGVNRVTWSPRYGFVMLASYCTERFKRRFESVMEDKHDNSPSSRAAPGKADQERIRP